MNREPAAAAVRWPSFGSNRSKTISFAGSLLLFHTKNILTNRCREFQLEMSFPLMSCNDGCNSFGQNRDPPTQKTTGRFFFLSCFNIRWYAPYLPNKVPLFPGGPSFKHVGHLSFYKRENAVMNFLKKEKKRVMASQVGTGSNKIIKHVWWLMFAFLLNFL